MKKTYLSVGLLLIAFLSRAQIKQGSILLGGSLAFGDSKNTPAGGANSASYRTTNFDFSPSYGRAIKDNLVLGFDLDVSYGKSAPNTFPGQENGYGAGVFLRKYKPLGGGFYIFGQSRLGFALTDNQSDYPPGYSPTRIDIKQLSVTASFFPGISYAINRRWQLETSLPSFLSLSYQHSKQVSQGGNSGNDGTTNGITLYSSLTSTYSFSVGLRYFIGG